MSIIAVQQEKGIVEKDLTSLASIMANKHRGPRPPDAVSIYKVSWRLASDSFDYGIGARISSSSTPVRLEKTKNFASKEKALQLKADIDAAFVTLGYEIEGRCWIEEDWYE